MELRYWIGTPEEFAELSNYLEIDAQIREDEIESKQKKTAGRPKGSKNQKR